MRVIVAVRACMREIVWPGYAWKKVIFVGSWDSWAVWLRNILAFHASEDVCPSRAWCGCVGQQRGHFPPKELSGCWLWKTGAPWLEYDILLELARTASPLPFQSGGWE